MRTEQVRQYNFEKTTFGLISTVLYLYFQIMHISLAYSQYDPLAMQLMNEAVTKSLIPNIDVSVPLAPMQFTSRDDMERYFLNDVNNLFSFASAKTEEKEYFHQVNHIYPFMKLTNIQSA